VPNWREVNVGLKTRRVRSVKSVFLPVCGSSDNATFLGGEDTTRPVPCRPGVKSMRMTILSFQRQVKRHLEPLLFLKFIRRHVINSSFSCPVNRWNTTGGA